MEIRELQEQIVRQQEQILTLQILVQTLADVLVETEVVSDEVLNTRLDERVLSIKKQMNEMRKEASIDFIKGNMFGNQMGEA